jgi:nucleotide-binding universal stress UspA family protein
MIRILVPVDGSEDTSRALDYVVGRHGRGAVTVSLIYVHEPPIWTHAVGVFLRRDTLREARARRARDVLAAATARLREAGIEAESSQVDGPLYRTITDEAARLGSKEVVLGVRPPFFGIRGLGRKTGFRRLDGDLPAYVLVGSQ